MVGMEDKAGASIGTSSQSKVTNFLLRDLITLESRDVQLDHCSYHSS